MSAELLTQAWATRGIGPAKKLILLALAKTTPEKADLVAVTIPALMADTDMTRPTLLRHLTQLVASQLVTREKAARNRTCYRLNIAPREVSNRDMSQNETSLKITREWSQNETTVHSPDIEIYSYPPTPQTPNQIPKAATPRESGFGFLDAEPLYAAACGLIPKPTTRSEIGRWARAIAELRDVHATPAQLKLAARRFRDLYPRAQLTITALSNNWTLLLQGDKPYGAHRPDTEQSRELERAQEEERTREREQALEWASSQLATDVAQTAAPDAAGLSRQV